MSRSLPKILESQTVAESHIFKIEQQKLEFSNGEMRQYERIVPSREHAGSVMIVPLLNDELILVREYQGGLQRYTLGFPKGLIDAGEGPEQAAARELMEEVGMQAKTFSYIKELAVSPGYLASKTHLVMARDLSPCGEIAGDEPEPLEVVHWPVSDLDRLLGQQDFVDARSMAAALWVARILQ